MCTSASARLLPCLGTGAGTGAARLQERAPGRPLRHLRVHKLVTVSACALPWPYSTSTQEFLRALARAQARHCVRLRTSMAIFHFHAGVPQGTCACASSSLCLPVHFHGHLTSKASVHTRRKMWALTQPPCMAPGIQAHCTPDLNTHAHGAVHCMRARRPEVICIAHEHNPRFAHLPSVAASRQAPQPRSASRTPRTTEAFFGGPRDSAPADSQGECGAHFVAVGAPV